MNLQQRWCDLTVAEYVAIERGVWLLSTAVWGIGTAMVGWLFLRWRRRRAEAVAPYPYPMLCLEPGPRDKPPSRCTTELGHEGAHSFVPYVPSSAGLCGAQADVLRNDGTVKRARCVLPAGHPLPHDDGDGPS
jgi:hypothetical protein